MFAKQGKRAILQKNVFKGGIAYFIEKKINPKSILVSSLKFTLSWIS